MAEKGAGGHPKGADLAGAAQVGPPHPHPGAVAKVGGFKASLRVFMKYSKHFGQWCDSPNPRNV